MRKGPTSKRYGEAFKRQIVSELEGGKTTLPEVRRKYGVAGGVTVRGWIQKYGSGKRVRGAALPERVTTTHKTLVLEREKRELEQTLARVTVEKVALVSLIKEAEAHLALI